VTDTDAASANGPMPCAVCDPTRWHIPEDLRWAYETDETGLHVDSLPRTIMRSNGSPHRVQGRRLKPVWKERSGLWCLRLATGRRGVCRPIYRRPTVKWLP
jgi:hypothetical protein